MRGLLVLIVCLVGCSPDDRVDPDKRTTPGGIFTATCTATADCACQDQEGGDALCERDSTQLQCLASRCSIACEHTSECTALFGAGVICGAGNSCLRN